MPSVDEGRVVRIEMSDLAFAPPQVILNAGETVTFVFHNVGALEHEFMAGTAAMKGMGYGKDWLAKANAIGGGHDMSHTGEGVRVAPGATAKLTLVVPAETGQFEFGCFVEGHYESGMRGVLVVSSSASSSAPAASPALAPSGHAMEGDGMDAEGH